MTNFLTDNGYRYEGSGGDIAKSMVAPTNWNSSTYPGTPGNDPASNNSSGFSGLPGGLRRYIGIFNYSGSNGNWWSSAEFNTAGAGISILNYFDDNVTLNQGLKDFGFSVRCLRDLPISPSGHKSLYIHP